MNVPRPVLQTALRTTVKPLLPRLPFGAQRLLLESIARGFPPPSGTTVERVVLGGRPAERVSPPDADPERAVLLLHGGAFVTCSPRTHRSLAGHLAAGTGAAVWVLDHRLAPEHPHPADLDDADAAFAQLSATARTSVVGDSAGGTLALLLALRLRAQDRALPSALGLVSPLVDLTLARSHAWTGPDPLLTRQWLQRGTSAWLAGADARALSPLTADLAGLPPTLVHVAEHERLRPEGEELVRRLAAAGVDVESELLPGLWHDAHLQAAVLPEAAQAVARLSSWLRRRG